MQAPGGTQILLKIKRNDIVLTADRNIEIDILLDTLKGNIVPNKAIFYVEAGKSYAFVVKRSRIARVEVEVTGTVNDMSIVEGLSPGTVVVTNPSLAKENQKAYFK